MICCLRAQGVSTVSAFPCFQRNEDKVSSICLCRIRLSCPEFDPYACHGGVSGVADEGKKLVFAVNELASGN